LYSSAQGEARERKSQSKQERKEVFPFSFLPDIWLWRRWENEKFLLLLLL
jgi:hypothetical protein